MRDDTGVTGVDEMRTMVHHGWRVTVRVGHGIGGSGCAMDRRIAASETSGAALKVGEAARWTRPVSGARSVLARWERRQDIGSPVEDPVGRR